MSYEAPRAPQPVPVASPAGTPSSTGTIAAAARPATVRRRTLGVGWDIGVPDGVNLGLAIAPADWLRLVASVGTNTAGFGVRGGVTFVPVGWGPSFSFEAGHCTMAPTNQLIRDVFKSPSWAKSYMQEFGYSYYNAHLGFDFVWGNVSAFLHGGYTYLSGTVHGPNSVVVDKSTQTTATIAEDGKIYAHTLSVKLGFVYLFGGF